MHHTTKSQVCVPSDLSSECRITLKISAWAAGVFLLPSRIRRSVHYTSSTPACQHTQTHTLLSVLLQLSDITGYLAVLSRNPFFFGLAWGCSSELLSLLLTVIHFINSCLHATLQHSFWTCSDNQIYSPGPEVTHKQGGCVVFDAGSQELGETQRDSPGLFISLSPITCAWVLHVEFLTVLNGIKDDKCGN